MPLIIISFSNNFSPFPSSSSLSPPQNQELPQMFFPFSMLLLLLSYLSPILFLSLLIQAQEHSLSPRQLDSVLQDYGFRAFVRPRPRTGEVYNANVPSNLTGITVSALRLRSGSLRKRGFRGFREFDLPRGIYENPYVERVVLVYQNLGNWSSVYYSLPGFDYLTPVLGLLAYNASDLSARDLPELDIRALENPILIRFENVGVTPPDGLAASGAQPMCVFFDLFGSVEFNNLVNGSVCGSTKQGHFGIVVESVAAPAPAPVTENPIPGIGGGGIGGGGGGWEGRKKLWLIVGCVVGGVLLVVLASVLVALMRRCIGRRRRERMERAAESGVDLGKATVGSAKMPVAIGTRTRPTLEKEYAP